MKTKTNQIHQLTVYEFVKRFSHNNTVWAEMVATQQELCCINDYLKEN